MSEDVDGESLAERIADVVAGDAQPWGLTEAGKRAAKTFVRELSTAERVALLKVSVARMPQLRKPGADPSGRIGATLYYTAELLYGSRPRLTEEDLVGLLSGAGHDCGHGTDVRPPFDLAIAYQRENGYSPALAGAIGHFIDQLPRSSAVKVNQLKRAAAMYAVLDLDAAASRKKLRPWIEDVRDGLRDLCEKELEAWQRLILHMAVREQMTPPATFLKPARALIDALGERVVVEHLTPWWPPHDRPVSLDDGGLPILKHFIWTLGAIRTPPADQLVSTISTIQFHRASEPMGVLKPALAYLQDAPGTDEARALLAQRIVQPSRTRR